MLVRFLQLIAAATALLHAVDAATKPTVQLPTGATISGIVESNVQGNLVNKYLGIPYTDAPIGDKRWKQSTVKDLTQDLNATAYGDVCHGNPASDAASGQFPNNEDCLYLNVFTPAGVTSKDKLPVMVWVHGGGFVAGAGNPYDGGSLIGASGQKVIVVNFNYRLGALGFLSNEEILAEGDGANFGLRDQETAFLWVKKYISSFGGNPNDITAFGESAGAISLAHHLLAHDGTQTLFKRAILQSGGYPSVQGMPTKVVQAQQTARLAAAVGCTDAPGGVLACLRTVPARAIFNASQSFNHFPTIDQVFISRAPFLNIMAGKVSRVPTIIGATTDDGWYYSFAGAEASQFDAFLRSTYPALTDAERERLKELYPASAFSSSHARASEIRGDEIFACAGAIFSNLLSATERDTYRYRFNQPSMKLGTPLALHADDLDYVFDRRYNLDNSTGSAAVVRHMQTYWTNFAVSGSPNGIQGDDPTQGGKPTFWPRYDVGKLEQIVLQPTLATEADTVRAARCAFWYELETRLAPGFDN